MSNRIMTLTAIEKAPKQFKDTHTVFVGGFKDGRITLELVNSKIDKLANVVEQLAMQMRQGFEQINARIDNLVAKNNLKE